MRKREGVFTHLTHRNTVSKQPHLLQFHPLSLLEGSAHGIGVHRLNADDLGLWPQLFHVGPDPRNQSASPDGDVNGMGWFRDLAHDLQPNRSLTRDHLRVIKGVDECQPFCFASTACLG